MMREVFGEKPFKNYLYAKLEEWDAYRMQVHDWELKRYMYKL
jgi:glutamine synthetase